MKKKFIAVVLAGCMILSLMACGTKKESVVESVTTDQNVSEEAVKNQENVNENDNNVSNSNSTMTEEEIAWSKLELLAEYKFAETREYENVNLKFDKNSTNEFEMTFTVNDVVYVFSKETVGTSGSIYYASSDMTGGDDELWVTNQDGASLRFVNLNNDGTQWFSFTLNNKYQFEAIFQK